MPVGYVSAILKRYAVDFYDLPIFIIKALIVLQALSLGVSSNIFAPCEFRFLCYTLHYEGENCKKEHHLSNNADSKYQLKAYQVGASSRTLLEVFRR